MTSSNAKVWNKKCFYWIFWEIKNLVMKFVQFMSYFKRQKNIKILYKVCGLKTSSRPCCVCKESSLKRHLRKSAYLFWQILIVLLLFIQRDELVSKVLFSNRCCAWFFINTKGPWTSFAATFFVEFFDKNCFQYYYINRPYFITRLCLLPKIFNKTHLLFSCFMLRRLLTSWNLIF